MVTKGLAVKLTAKTGVEDELLGAPPEINQADVLAAKL
jgi:hypothetical protein